MSDLYHIIRVRDGAYWRPDGKGYTDKIAEAGVFDDIYAFGVVATTHGEHKCVEVASDEGSSILVSNLEEALSLAIASLARSESVNGPGFRSCQRTAYEQNLAYLRKHGYIDVRS